jgi:GTP-binding protein
MLLDEVDITIRAGHGGAGKVSFAGDGPDGGNGGKGGNVFITVTSDLKALNQFSSESNVSATNGEPGSNRRSFGKKGRDLVLILPLGTTLTDKDSGDSLELTSLDQNILICKGGIGGRGNLEFKSSKNRSPDYAQPGRPGEFKKFKVILRFIADLGLVGLPNAGKSSLLNELTNAKAVTAAYPFTTLEANLGAFGSKIIADIPGLIEGASSGKGLGTKFLKHIEKVKMLLHCIAADSADIVADYNSINQELQIYNPELLNKQRIILLTKSDLVNDQTLSDQMAKLSTLGYPVYPVSIYDLASINSLKLTLNNKVSN